MPQANRIDVKSAGFTVVELMVVVAMVGVLAMIGMPQYNHFTARARQTEAKIALAGAYAAEKAFWTEHGTYTYCLRQAGYVSGGGTRFYLVGASTANQTFTLCGPQGDRDCRKFDFANDHTCDAADPSCCNAINFNGSNTVPGWPANLASSDIIYGPNTTADKDYRAMYDLLVGPSVGGIGLDTHVERDHFKLGAAGCIYPINSPNYWTSPVPSALRSTAHAAAAFDGWTIDENKRLSNPNPGA